LNRIAGTSRPQGVGSRKCRRALRGADAGARTCKRLIVASPCQLQVGVWYRRQACLAVSAGSACLCIHVNSAWHIPWNPAAAGGAAWHFAFGSAVQVRLQKGIVGVASDGSRLCLCLPLAVGSVAGVLPGWNRVRMHRGRYLTALPPVLSMYSGCMPAVSRGIHWTRGCVEQYVAATRKEWEVRICTYQVCLVPAMVQMVEGGRSSVASLQQVCPGS
jgi:hypothetical protein